MVRNIIAVVLGFIAGSITNMGIVVLSWSIYPPPEGAMLDAEKMAAFVQTLPAPAFALVLLAHTGGALVGGLVAALIARQNQLLLGAIVGALFLVGGIMNAASIPAPLWFVIADLASYIPAGIFGATIANRVPRR